MKKWILLAVLGTAGVAYGYITSESIGAFGIPRSLQYGDVQKFVDGDTTCYLAVSRKAVAISCVK